MKQLSDAVGGKFFNPLTGSNMNLYFNCIRELVVQPKKLELRQLYETDAKEILSRYLETSGYRPQMEEGEAGDELNPDNPPLVNAAAILRRFRECGWISGREAGRSGDNTVFITPQCRNLVSFLEKLSGGRENVALTNQILGMHDILNSYLSGDEVRRQDPWKYVLSPLYDAKISLEENIHTLEDRMSTIAKSLAGLTDANSLGQSIVSEEEKRFFSDYFFIRRDGSIPAYLQDLRRWLVRLREPDTHRILVRCCMEDLDLDEYEAEAETDDTINDIDAFLSITYDETMGYIDAGIASHDRMRAARMRTVLGDETDTRGLLNRLLSALGRMDPEEKDTALHKVGECLRLSDVSIIGRASLERGRKSVQRRNTSPVRKQETTQEEKIKMAMESLAGTVDRYRIEEARRFMDMAMAGKTKMDAEEFDIRTRDNTLMLAACVSYSDAAGFPYKAYLEDGEVAAEAATFRRFRMERKNDGRMDG